MLIFVENFSTVFLAKISICLAKIIFKNCFNIDNQRCKYFIFSLT